MVASLLFTPAKVRPIRRDICWGLCAGGAIAANNASLVTIITSTFTSNVAENGGAIFIEEVGLPLPCQCQSLSDLPVTLWVSKIWQNITTSERSLQVQCGKATVNDNTFTKNKATRSGGAVFQSKCSGENAYMLIC